MNLQMIADFRKGYDEVKVVLHEGNVPYIYCTNYYPADYDVEKILKEAGNGDRKKGFGEVVFTDKKIIVTRKIKDE